MILGCCEPISLGHTCEVKYQLSRRLHAARFPYAPEGEVRAMIAQGFGSAHFRRHIFDFQITPFSALCAYLEQDFEGVFEEADLQADQVTGHVTHRKLFTSHPHDFELHEGEVIDRDFIRAAYPEARAKFDHLAQRFRLHLQAPGRFLYVFMEMRSPAEVEHLLRLLSRSSRHEVYLLLVDYAARDTDYSSLGGRVFKGVRDGPGHKAIENRWEGDDATWDRLLAPFDLGIHERDWAREKS